MTDGREGTYLGSSEEPAGLRGPSVIFDPEKVFICCDCCPGPVNLETEPLPSIRGAPFRFGAAMIEIGEQVVVDLAVPRK